MADRIILGLLSDTHNWLRPEIPDLFAGCDAILHAGDICSSEILDQLKETAPVHAVRGNSDHGAWADSLPRCLLLEYGGVPVYMLHDLAKIDLKPEASGIRVVVHGHTHRFKAEERGRVVYVNPGSAGTSRGGKPSVARMILEGGAVRIEVVEFAQR